MQSLWPTARGWILMTGSFLWLLMAITNNKLLPFLFACACFSLCLASLLAALFSLRRISLERAPIGDGVTGRAISMPLVLSNLTAYPRQSLLVVEACNFGAEPWIVTPVYGLKGRETRLVERNILAARRGKHKLNHISLRSGDPGGLFLRERRFSLPAQTLIVPGTEPLPDLQLLPRHLVHGATGTPLGISGGSQDIYSIREYSPGDGMRRIHWRSSARFGHLMVREFERNAIRSVAVVVDAQSAGISGPEHWSNLEYQVHAAASVCVHVAGLYCQLALGLGGDKLVVVPPAPAAEVEQRVLWHLAMLKPGGVTLTDTLYRLGEMLSQETVVFCFSLGETEPVAKALEVLRLRGLSTRWFSAAPGHFHKHHAPPNVAPAEPGRHAIMQHGAIPVYPGISFAGVLTHGP